MIELEIITPHRKLLSLQCASVTLPGVSGEFEVLEGHEPMLASLKIGIVSLREPKNMETTHDFGTISAENFKIMIAAGFAEVGHGHVSVLCEAAAMPSEVDIDQEKAFIEKLHEKMKSMSEKNEKEFKIAEAELERATTKIQIV